MNYNFDTKASGKVTMHTAVLLDLDWPSKGAREGGHNQRIHWMIMNIKDNRIDTGAVVFSYLQCAPYYNSGPHRFVFLIYEQEGYIDVKNLPFDTSERNCPEGIMTRARVLRLGTPVVSICLLTHVCMRRNYT